MGRKQTELSFTRMARLVAPRNARTVPHSPEFAYADLRGLVHTLICQAQSMAFRLPNRLREKSDAAPTVPQRSAS